MLKGKNALITGARKGIGRATVKVFAENGANIWACARKQDDNFEADMQALSQQYEVEIKPIFFDIQDTAETKSAVQAVVKEKKSIDILVNNAGVAEYNGFLFTDTERMQRALNNNFVAPLYLTQLVARRMTRNNCGSIIFLSSISGLIGEDGCLAYGSSKAAVAYAVKVLSKELAQYNIRVNGVAPGMVNTDMAKKADQQYWNELVSKIYLNRMAEPEEVANVICFLASDSSSYVNGQIIRVDGGMQ